MLASMSIADLTAGILAGNLLTLLFLWGAREYSRARNDAEVSWFGYGAVALPIFILLMSVLATEPLPPFLDALSPLLSSDADYPAQSD